MKHSLKLFGCLDLQPQWHIANSTLLQGILSTLITPNERQGMSLGVL